MLFNSFAFAVFFPIVFILYWRMPHKWRWMLVLLASYYFYMSWNAKYVFIIFLTTAVSYFAALFIEKEKEKQRKKVIMAVVAIICLGVLFFFKYFDFVSESITNILNMFTLKMTPMTLNLVLPVGISFYTFQTLSYVIDVYKGDVSAEPHFGKYAAFVSFFPQLVAGPIERSSNLLPQIKAEHEFDYDKATYGLKLMAWGYFKKVVIADTLSQIVSKVYDYPQRYHGFALVLATIFFTFQIYCDFSGYSDIAVGTAKMMGIDLMINFKSPYFSQSIKEFWSRWHISLSTWFRDYVYIPLGGNRVGRIRHYFNLIVTFLVSGLWHGANWTFVIWGAVHGVAQVIEDAVLPKKHKKSTGVIWVARVLLVFVFCSFAWIFFAAQTVQDAFYIISNIFVGIGEFGTYLYTGFSVLEISKIDLVFLCASMLLLIIYDYISLKRDVIDAVSSNKSFVRWCVYCVFVLWIIINLPVADSTEFIYFQF